MRPISWLPIPNLALDSRTRWATLTVMLAEDRPVQRAGVLTESVGVETLLSGPDGAAIHALNASASVIWRLCDGQHTPVDIAAHLSAQFTTTPETDVLADVRRTLAIFRANGLLE